MGYGYGYGYRVHCNVFENTNVEKIEYIEYLNTIWIKSFFVLVPKAGLVVGGSGGDGGDGDRKQHCYDA